MHNRVHDIELVAEHVRALVPEARVAVAHGQMDESRLERVVLDFWEHEYDVLVCTTIVESGLDMPTVNTLVVDRSDLLGLAQLYQLRGRVGRRGQRAYAYLFHPADRVLTEEAYERLKTIGEFTDLGSGFKIAMRDLEIRGAGNLLGAAQSGHIAAVGFDLYCQMVTEAVGELKGEPVPEPLEITIDLPVDANLPRDYVARDDVRMEAYRRLAAVTDPADVDDVRAEWEDRYGPPPPSAVALLDVARLRAECVRLGIRSITVQRNTARITGLELRESQKVRLRRLAPKAVAKDDELVVADRRCRPAEVADRAGRAARRSCSRRPPSRERRASLRNAMNRRLPPIVVVVVSVICRGGRGRSPRSPRDRAAATVAVCGERHEGVAGRRSTASSTASPTARLSPQVVRSRAGARSDDARRDQLARGRAAGSDQRDRWPTHPARRRPRSRDADDRRRHARKLR